MAIDRDQLTAGVRFRGLVAARDVTVIDLEVNASSTGFTEHTVRTVKENAGNLGAKSNEFEA